MIAKFSFHEELNQDLGHFDLPEHGQALDRHGDHIPGDRVINGAAGKMHWSRLQIIPIL